MPDHEFLYLQFHKPVESGSKVRLQIKTPKELSHRLLGYFWLSPSSTIDPAGVAGQVMLLRGTFSTFLALPTAAQIHKRYPA